MLMRYLLLAVIYAESIHHASSTPPPPLRTVVIGGLFDTDGFMRKSFSLAIRTMNECAYFTTTCDMMDSCKNDIDCLFFHELVIAGVMIEVEDDLLTSLKRAEELQRLQEYNEETGLSLLIGPHTGLSTKYVQGWCEMFDMPNIVIRREMDHDRLRSINLYPDLETLATVYVKMVQKLNWTSFSILYDDTENYLTLDNVLKMYAPFDPPIFAFYLGKGPNYSEPLLAAKEKHHKNLIIDCSYKNLARILKQTQEVGMMTEYYQYIITSLDLQTIDLHPYQHSGVNISGMRLVDPGDPFVSSFVGSHLEELDIPSVEKLLTEDALMFDAVALFAEGYKDFTYHNQREVIKMNEEVLVPKPWPYGVSLRNYILYNMINGLTGPVMLDSDGSRRRFKLDILNLHKTGLTKVGVWNPDDGFDDLRLLNELKMKHFNVLITMTAPYAMRVNYSKSMEGNERYEGFVVDIIKELSTMIGFNYTFHVQEDAQNGVCNKTQNEKCVCTGMMDKILKGEMDMAITDLTITKEREECVDFSTAFWNLGMSILYKKPTKAPATLFSFLSPFHSLVWIYLAGIYVFVSMMFFVLGRLTPAEWNNPFPCIDEPRELQNQFTISNSFWFTMGAIMQQGSELAPIGKSTRTLAGCWWFFCLIIISTYTANLAAFLTIESPVKVLRGIEDLYNQTKIKYGAKKDGSTFMYFKSSKNPKYRQLANQMESKEWEKWMVSENADGIKLAKDPNLNYAFIMESSTIEYIAYRYCELENTGELIDQKSYAIAYKKNFEYNQQISRSISILQERLVIKNLYEKWWKQKGATCAKDDSTSAMNLEQLAGVFLVLGIGIAISCILTIFEFCRGIQLVSKKESIDFMEQLSSEIKCIVKSKAVKPVFKRKKSSDSNLSENYSCDYTMTTQA